jgi:hypothetical protein
MNVEKEIAAYIDGDRMLAQAGDAEAAERCLEQGYRGLQNRYGGEPEYAQDLFLERNGGPCPYCKKPFKKVTKLRTQEGKVFDSGALYWFEPNCACFERCLSVELKSGERFKGCGRWKIYERFKGLKHCRVCRPVRKDDEKESRQSKPIARKPYHERSVAQGVDR